MPSFYTSRKGFLSVDALALDDRDAAVVQTHNRSLGQLMQHMHVIDHLR